MVNTPSTVTETSEYIDNKNTPNNNLSKNKTALSITAAAIIFAFSGVKESTAAIVAIAPQNTDPLEAYDVLSAHDDLSVLVSGDGTDTISTVNFELSANAPGIDRNMIDNIGVTIKNVSGNILGVLTNFSFNLTQAGIVSSVSSDMPILINEQDYSVHLSDQNDHNIAPGFVIAQADYLAPENNDKTWSTAGTDGTFVFSVEGTQSVPEPATTALLGLGTAGFFIRRKRQKSRQS